jgi:hypothetical protein
MYKKNSAGKYTCNCGEEYDTWHGLCTHLGKEKSNSQLYQRRHKYKKQAQALPMSENSVCLLGGRSMRRLISQPRRLIEGGDGGGTIVTHMRSPNHPQATSDQIASSEKATPVDWTKLRLDPNRQNYLYFSPDKKLTFYSKREVRNFARCIVMMNGDEIAALELHEREWPATTMPRSQRLLQSSVASAISQAPTSPTGNDVSASPSACSTSLVNVEAARDKLVAETGAPTAAAAAPPYEPVPVGVDGRDGVATAAVAGKDGRDAIEGSVYGEYLGDEELEKILLNDAEFDEMEGVVGLAKA